MGLYKHQLEAVERFHDKSEIGLGFEMGCGKSATVLTIAQRKFEAGEIDRVLIIAPNDVHRQWYNEQLELWLGCNYQARCIFGRGGMKKFLGFHNITPDTLMVVCVNIETFSTKSKWKLVSQWANAGRTFIILDEATSIKNPSSLRSQNILYGLNNNTIRRGKRMLSTTILGPCRAVLTGTPVTNGPMDLWAIMEFLRPNFFGRNWYSFRQHYCMLFTMNVAAGAVSVPLTENVWCAVKNINDFARANHLFGVSEDTFNVIHSQTQFQGAFKHADELKQLISDVWAFKLLKDCADMPEQVYTVHSVGMSIEQERCYKDMVYEYTTEYAGHSVSALNKLVVMVKLQQISSGFLFNGDVPVGDDCEVEGDITPDAVTWIGKTNPKLEKLYSDIGESAKPVIVITRFSAEAARIYQDLSKIYNPCLITGWKRIGTVDEFKDGKYDIMVANQSVIARGFNLQNSCTMLFYSNSFSLELRLQAEGRIFRLGQSRPCQYIDYICEGTVDKLVVERLRQKKSLLDYIRGVDSLNEII
ncbi:MAG: hypothetical protein Pg6A_19730 [Termitinemataceae bacterium]|nr:MAG: hypothetical protein Pg6A_19730 [Termitinemataceae bacterium]